MLKIVLGFMALVLLGACSGGFPDGIYETGSGDMLELREDGNYILFSLGAITHSGTYSVRGDEITLEMDFVFCDQFAPGEGVYTWTFEEDILLFSLVEDPCGARGAFFDGLRFHKSD